jgi:hypothetical protein
MPYDQDEWAVTSDSLTLPVEVSLDLLKALHMRWCASMEVLSVEDWHKEFYHPEHKKGFTLYQLAANYAWHGDHHCRHITDLRARNNW